MKRILIWLIALGLTAGAAIAQTNSGPILTPKVDTWIYPGVSPYLTIQQAVTAGCNDTGHSHKGLVAMLPGFVYTDTPTTVTGCVGVGIVNYQVTPWACYASTGGLYAATNCASGGGGAGVISWNSRTGAVTLSANDVETILAGNPYNITVAACTDFHGDGPGIVQGAFSGDGLISCQRYWNIGASNGLLTGYSAGGTANVVLNATNGNASFTGTLTAAHLADSSLTSGNCTQATTGGQLSNSSGPCVVRISPTGYNGPVPVGTGGDIQAQMPSNFAFSSALTSSGFEEIYTTNGNHIFTPDCLYVGNTGIDCGALGSAYIFATGNCGTCGAGVYVRDVFAETSFTIGKNAFFVANNVANEHSVFLGVAASTVPSATGVGEPDTAYLATEFDNIKLHIAGLSVDIRGGSQASTLSGLCVGCVGTNIVSLPSIGSGSSGLLKSAATTGAVSNASTADITTTINGTACVLGSSCTPATGTMSDGAGTTTAGQVAVSTTTAHQVAYVASLPVTNGGTGANTLAIHGVLTGQATAAIHATAAGATNAVLVGQGASADPIFAAQPAIDCTNCTNIPVGTRRLSCQPGLGDGLNAIPAGTYLTTTCRNETGGTWTLTAIRCVADAGSSTCNATNGAGTGLLTGAITGTSTYANGTQSGTTTIASGDYLKVTYVADGTSKQIGIDVVGTY